MTARPVPAEQDHIDAVARVVLAEVKRYPMAQHGPTGRIAWGATEHTLADAILTTDDSAAVAAIANEWAARHPAAILDALTNVGVLTEYRAERRDPCGCIVPSDSIGSCCFNGRRTSTSVVSHQTEWTEVQP